MKQDRIEITYGAIDEMISVHNTPRPEKFGGGLWNAEEEFVIYKKQVGKRYTFLQWKIISEYFKLKLKEKT
jgi:hypothetical protein